MTVRLFVRSNRTSVTTGHVSMETMGAAHTSVDYAEGTYISSLPPQDSLAKDGLRKSGIRFETVDLSSGVRSKLTARLRGVKETPTLLDEDSKMRRYVGVAAISQYIKESKTLIRE